MLAPSLVSAEELAPEGPRSSLDAEEREAFVEQWLDVLARGTRDLNDTPGAMAVTPELEFNLTMDVVRALRAYNDTMAAQFDPAVGGPALGLSDPSDPLVDRRTGELLTAEDVEMGYAALVNALAFHRAELFERLESFAEGIATPDVAPSTHSSGNESIADPVREEMEAIPLLRWGSRVADAVPPPAFVLPQPLEVGFRPPAQPPRNLTQAIGGSPFLAAPESAWLDPSFRLPLSGLLDSMANQTGLTGSVALLQDVARAGHQVARVADASLDRFPRAASALENLERAVGSLRDAVEPLPTPEGLREIARDLPPEVYAILEEVARRGEDATYTVQSGNRTYRGVWGLPTPVDLDGDGRPDLLATLGSAPPDPFRPEDASTVRPRLTLERAGAHSPVPPDRLPLPGAPGARPPVDLVVAFRHPESGRTTAMEASFPGGLDVFDATLDRPDAAVRFGASVGEGPFRFRTVVAPSDAEEGFLVLAVEGPRVPQAFGVAGAAEPRGRNASLALDSLAPAALNLSVLWKAVDDPDSPPSPALSLRGGALRGTTVRLAEDALDVRAPAGSSYGIEALSRILSPDGGVVVQGSRLEVSDAPGRVLATVGLDGLSFEGDRSGADVEMHAGALQGSFLDGVVWSAVEGAGRRFGVDPRGAAFETDAAVERVRATWASGHGVAVAGLPEEAGLLVAPDVVAFHAEGSRGVSIDVGGADGYRVEVRGGSGSPFSIAIERPDSRAGFRFASLPGRAAVEVGASGVSVSATERIAQLEAMVTSLADPSMILGNLTGVSGATALRFGEGALNVGLSDRLDHGTILSSNVPDPAGGFRFLALAADDPLAGANLALAEVEGAVRRHTAEIRDAVTQVPGVPANLLGSLLGPVGHVELEFEVEGPLCQSLGAAGATFTLCISNVPRRIAIDVALSPEFSVTYNASEPIREIRLQVDVEAADLSAFLVLQDVPRVIQFVVGDGAFTARTDSPLGGLVLGGSFARASFAVGLERLPTTLGVTWGPAGVVPFFGEDEELGRIFLFVSAPGFALAIDLSNVPLFSLGWSDGSFGLSFPPGRRLGSAKVQMVLDVLDQRAVLLLLAEGLPGFEVAWRADGGVVRTLDPVGLVTLQIDAGRTLSLVLSVTGVPSIEARWTAGDAEVRLGDDGRVDEILLQFIAGPLLVYLRGEDVPAIVARRTEGGVHVGASDGTSSVGLLALVIAYGSGYYDPLHRPESFIGLRLRPEEPSFGLSVALRGFRGVTWRDPTPSEGGRIDVSFDRARDLKAVVDLATSQIFLRLDATLRDLPPGVSIEFGKDQISVSTTSGAGAGASWLQAAVELGTASGDAALPAPYWPYETSGQQKGIMGNTLLDVERLTVATKWKIYVPLPTSLRFTKSLSAGAGGDAMPSYRLETEGGLEDLGKLDIRARVVLPVGSTRLDVLAIATATNLPLGLLSVSQTMGSQGALGVNVTLGKPIDEIFVGLRFDGEFYPADDGGRSRGGFLVWASLRDVPAGFFVGAGRQGGSSGGAAVFHYEADASTLDGTVYLDFGAVLRALRDVLGPVRDAGPELPEWIRFILDHEPDGHIILGFEDMPAQGLVLGLADGAVEVSVPDLGCVHFVGCLGAERIGSIYLDLDFSLRGREGESGCLACVGAIQVRYHWGFEWTVGIKRLHLLLEDLAYLRLKPGLESNVVIDGRLLFDFLAFASGTFDAGISIHVVIAGTSYEVVCFCATVHAFALVQGSYLTAQILTDSWSINYFTIGYPCGLFTWCEHHFNVGVSYTYPGNWRIDSPIAYPPYRPFRGLDIDSSADGPGRQSYLLYVDPVTATCIHMDTLEGCASQGRPLVPYEFIMIYSFASYFSLDGPRFWTDDHEH